MAPETILLLLISSIFLAISPQAYLVKIFNLLKLSSWWGGRVDVTSQLLIIYAVIGFCLAAISYLLHKRGHSLMARMAQLFRRAPSGGLIGGPVPLGGMGRYSGWLSAALMIGVAIRIYFLTQPMRGDEAFTFLNFANKGFIALFDYPAPNNHVFNTLLIKIATLALGGSPAAIRLPAFLAGIAIIPLTYQLARTLNPQKSAGVTAALACAVFPYLILYSTNARGYSLVILLTLALALAGLRYANHPDGSGIGWLAVLSALGMWSMPTMLFGIAGISCWLAAVLWTEKHPLQRIFLDFALPFGVLTALFTFILYTPVILVSNGISAIIANKFVESQSWPEFTSQLVPKLQSTIIELIRDVPLVAVASGLMLIVVGLYFSLNRDDRRTFLLLPGLAVGAVILLAAQHTTPYARLWIYSLPFLFILADYGFTHLAEKFVSKWHPHVQASLLTLAALLAVRLAAGNVITNYPDTSAFPEAPIAAQYLKPILQKNDRVRVTNTADWSIYYYFWYYDIPYSLEDKQADTGKTFIIVKKSRYSLSDMTDKPVIKLLEKGDLALYQEVKP